MLAVSARSSSSKQLPQALKVIRYIIKVDIKLGGGRDCQRVVDQEDKMKENVMHASQSFTYQSCRRHPWIWFIYKIKICLAFHLISSTIAILYQTFLCSYLVFNSCLYLHAVLMDYFSSKESLYGFSLKHFPHSLLISFELYLFGCIIQL